MSRKNRIIVLLDFSDYSQTLVKFSSEFSKCIHASVVFVHCVPGLVPALTENTVRDQIISIEKEEAWQNFRNLTQGYDFIDEDFIASEKSILTILDQFKSEHYFNWVFTGLKGTGFLKKIFMGSTTLKIIDDSDLLTVAIPLKAETVVPSRLVVSLSYRYPVNRIQLSQVLAALSGQIKAVEFITVITENDDEEESIAYLDELKQKYSAYHPVTHSYHGVEALSDISAYMANKNDAFLVVQQGSRSLTDSLFRKFIINELVYQGAIPLIVISK